jgi:elongation factor G
MKYPPDLVEIAVEPKTRSDSDRLIDFLSALADENVHLVYSRDLESGIIVLKGSSEFELETLVHRIQHEADLALKRGRPQVAYRETITKVKEHDYTHKKQTGGSGQFARVKIRFEPLPPGGGFEFENDVVGGAVPKEYVPGVEKGLKLAKESGVIAGFPMIDFKATLIDGAYHDVDSNVMTFDIAARACFREAIPQAGPKLLEPMMKVEVVTPEEYLGDVIGDLNSRRGQVQGMEARGNAQVVTAMVPLANMFGYANDLKEIAGEHTHFTMAFDHYEQVPPAAPSPDDSFPGAMALREGAKLA